MHKLRVIFVTRLWTLLFFGVLFAGLTRGEAYWQSRSSSYNQTVGGATLSCSYTPVLTATFNLAYTGATPSAGGGTPGYTFSNTGSLPPGFSINSSTGVISGTDSVDSGGATYPGIQVQVTDNASSVANCGASFTITVVIYQGPKDVQTGWTAWWGLRAYSNALANAGATTTPVMNVRGATTGTSCTIYLLGNGTGNLDFTTAGLGSVGAQCLLGATTFCTVTNTSCTVSKVYDQTVGSNCAGSCDAVQGTTANQPTLIMPGSCNYPNSASLPCLQAASNVIALNSTGNFTPNAAAQVTVSAVGIRVSGTNEPYFGAQTVANGTRALNSANEWFQTVNSGTGAIATSVADNAWHSSNSVMLAGAGADILNVDGTEFSGTTTPATAAGVARFLSGGATTTSQHAEAGFIDNVVLTQTQRAAVCDNQAKYYGTTIGAHC